MKIDVEGAEFDVLQGLRRTILERRVRLIDLELSDTLAGPNWDPLVPLLHELEGMATSTFSIDQDGKRDPMSVETATHKDFLSHFVLAFDR